MSARAAEWPRYNEFGSSEFHHAFGIVVEVWSEIESTYLDLIEAVFPHELSDYAFNDQLRQNQTRGQFVYVTVIPVLPKSEQKLVSDFVRRTNACRDIMTNSLMMSFYRDKANQLSISRGNVQSKLASDIAAIRLLADDLYGIHRFGRQVVHGIKERLANNRRAQ